MGGEITMASPFDKFFKSLPPFIQQTVKQKTVSKPSPEKKTETKKDSRPVTAYQARKSKTKSKTKTSTPLPPVEGFQEIIQRGLPPTVRKQPDTTPTVDWDKIKESEPPESGTIQKSPDTKPIVSDKPPSSGTTTPSVTTPPPVDEKIIPDVTPPSTDTTYERPVGFYSEPITGKVEGSIAESLGYTDRPTITAPPLGASGYEYGTVDPSTIKPKFVETPIIEQTGVSSQKFWERAEDLKMSDEEIRLKELNKQLVKPHNIGTDPETGKPIVVTESPYQVKFGYKPNDPDYYSAKSDIQSDIANTENTLENLNKFVPMAERNLITLKTDFDTVKDSPTGSMFEVDLNNDGIIDPDTEIKDRKFVMDFLQEQIEANRDVASYRKDIPTYEKQLEDLRNFEGILGGYERLGYELDVSPEGEYSFDLPSDKEVFEWRFGDQTGLAYTSQAFMQSPLAIETFVDILAGGGEAQKETLAKQGLGQLFTLEQKGVGSYFVGDVATSPAMIEGVVVPSLTLGLGYGASSIGSKIGGKLAGFGGKLTSTGGKFSSTGSKIISGTFSNVKAVGKPFFTAGKTLGKLAGTKVGGMATTGLVFGAIESPGIIETYQEDPSQTLGYIARRGFGWGLAIGSFKAGSKLFKSGNTTVFKPKTTTQQMYPSEGLMGKVESFMETGRMGKIYGVETGKWNVGLGERFKLAITGKQAGYTTGRMFPSTWKPMVTGRETVTSWEQLRGKGIDPFAPKYPTAETAWGYDPYVTSSVYDPTFGQKYAISKYTGRIGGKKYILTSEDFLSGKEGKLIPDIDESKIGSKYFMEGDRPVKAGTEAYGKFVTDKTVRYDEPFWFYKEQPRTLIPTVDESKIGTKYFMEADRPATVGREIYGRYAFSRTPTKYEPFWFYKEQAPGTLIPTVDESKIGTKYFMEGDRPAKFGREIFGRYAFTGTPTATVSGIDVIKAPVDFTPTTWKFTEKPTTVKPTPLTETVKPSTKTLTPTKPTSQFEWYQSPKRDITYVKGTGGIGRVPDAYSMAYGRTPLEFLEFLEEGTGTVSPYWSGKGISGKPSISGGKGGAGIKPLIDTVIGGKDITKVDKITGTGEVGVGVTGEIEIGELGEIGLGKEKIISGKDIFKIPDVGVKKIPDVRTGVATIPRMGVKQSQKQSQALALLSAGSLRLTTKNIFPTRPIKYDLMGDTRLKTTKVGFPKLQIPWYQDVTPKKKKRTVRRIKKEKRISDVDVFDKGLLSDIVSVTKTQARYGVATHPRLTEDIWKRGEESLFARVPTLELLKEEKGKGKKKGEKIVLY